MRNWQARQGDPESADGPSICAFSKPTQVTVRRVVTDWPLENNLHVFQLKKKSKQHVDSKAKEALRWERPGSQWPLLRNLSGPAPSP